MKILLAPNSFKECLTATGVAATLMPALHRQNGGRHIHSCPLSDGGDGFLAVCNNYFHLEQKEMLVQNCMNTEKINVPFGYCVDSKKIYIESADVFGMKTVVAERRSIMQASSAGLGQILQNLLNLKENGLAIESIVVGLGGSLINDFGMGCFEQLGGILLDEEQQGLSGLPDNFPRISHIIPPETRYPIPIEVVLDVDVPIFGSSGTSAVFGRQKGATDADLAILENFSLLVHEFLKRHCVIYQSNQQIGASGAIVAGLCLSASVSLIHARRFILDTLKLNEELETSAIVITSEGRFDTQSLKNKAAGILIERARELNKKVIVVCGSNQLKENEIPENVLAIELLPYFGSLKASMNGIHQGLQLAAQEIERIIAYEFGE